MQEALGGKTIKRTNKVAWRSFNKQGVVLDMSSSKMFGLNRNGAKLWELLGEDMTLSGLIHRFADEVQKKPADIEDDVVEFVTALETKGLVNLI